MTRTSFTPTKKMAANAERGLKLRDRFGRGGTEVGVQRARQLSAQRQVDATDLKAMTSYFARHAVDRQNAGAAWGSRSDPSAGYIAWLLWGGDAGRDWAERKRKALDI